MYKLLISSFLILFSSFLFLLPPFQGPDEIDHWRAAIENSKLLSSSSSYKKCDAQTQLVNWVNSPIQFHYSKKIQTGRYERLPETLAGCTIPSKKLSYGSALTYFPVLIAKSFIKSEEKKPTEALHLFYLSRFIGGLSIFIVIWFFLHNSKYGKKFVIPGFATILCILISPIAIQQSTIITSDLIGILAVLLALQYNFKPPSKRIFLALVILCSYAAIKTKLNILPIIVALILFTKPVLDTVLNRKFAFNRIFPILISLALVLVGIYTYLNFDGNAHHAVSANPVEQHTYIRENFIEAFFIIYNSFSKFFGLSTLFSSLGWLDTPLNGKVINSFRNLFYLSIAFDFALIIGANNKRKKKKSSLKKSEIAKRFVLISAVITSVFLSGWLTSYVMYVQWSPPRSNISLGLQPRYFIPHLIVLVYCIFQFIKLAISSINFSFVLRYKPIITKLYFGIFIPAVIILLIKYIVSLDIILLKRYL